MPPERYVEILADLKPRFIHHPRAKELIAGLLAELGRRHRQDLLRRAAPAHDGARRVPEGRPRLPVPRPPRHVVLGAACAAELVAAGVRDRVGELDGVPPAVLRRADQEQLGGLRLRRVEPDRAQAGGEDGQEGDAQAAAGRGAARARARRARRDAAGGTIVFSAAQLHSTVPNTTDRTRFSIDFRTVNLDDLRERRRRAERRLASAPARRCATSCGRATSRRCPRRSSSGTTLRRRQRRSDPCGLARLLEAASSRGFPRTCPRSTIRASTPTWTTHPMGARLAARCAVRGSTRQAAPDDG